jgi:uncharacterized repeat protein (TIGR01451 family)
MRRRASFTLALLATAAAVSVAAAVASASSGADLTLNMVRTSHKTVVLGTAFTYAIFVANNGTDTANNVQLNDALPAGITFVNVTTTLGSCSQSAGTVSCNLGNLVIGGRGTVTISVLAGSVGTWFNTSTVGSDTPDPTLANNSGRVKSTVVS